MGLATRTRATAAAVALAILLLGASGARAGFAPAPEQLSDPLDGVGHLAVAVAPGGNAIAVWDEIIGQSNPLTLQVRGRRLAPDGTLGPVLPLLSGSDSAVNSDVAVGPNGRAFAVWQVPSPTPGGHSSIKGTWIETDGSLGPIVTVLTASMTEDGVVPHVVVDASGIATVGWENQAQGVGFRTELRRVGPDGSLGTQINTTLSAVPFMAALPSGATFVIGDPFDGTSVTVAANGNVGTVQTLATSGSASSLEPGIAFDAKGDGLVAWRKGNGPPNSVMARRIDPTGAPTGPELTVDPTTTNFESADYRVAVDSSGRFLVAWFKQDSVNSGHAFVRAVNLDGSFPDPPQPVSDLGSGEPQVALDDRGTGLAAFDFRPPNATDSTVQGRILGVGAEPVSGFIPLGGSGGSTVANDPATGVAAVLFLSRAGGKETVMARRFLEPPTCSDATATVVQGRPVVIPVSCTGLALRAAGVVKQPAHGTVTTVSGQPLSLRYTPTPGFQGSDSFTFAGLSDGGFSAPSTARLTVGRDTVPPVVRSFGFRRTTGSTASAARAKTRRPPKNAYSFVLRYSEGSTAQITIQKPTRGVLKGKRCRARRGRARGRSCTLYRRVGLLTSRQLSASATVRVPGKLIARLAKLGSLRATAVATDAAGNKSKPRRLRVRFKVRG